MATVFEAVNEQIGKKVAVKLLRPELSHNPEIERRFLNEARAVNLAQHPGLVNIFEFGRTPDGSTYIVMEYLDGAPLSAYIRQHHPIPINKSLYLAQQLASALAAAHSAGVVHRDLKPANIIVVKDPGVPGEERPKVFDFGIAKLEMQSWLNGPTDSHRTKPGIVLGTPTYMAPEQVAEPSGVSDRADVYSLGIILFEMLTGQLPEEGIAVPLALHQNSASLQKLREGNVSLAEEIELHVDRMMALESRARPSMHEVKTVLAQLIGRAEAKLREPGGEFPSTLQLQSMMALQSPPPMLSASLAQMIPPEPVREKTRRQRWMLGAGAGVPLCAGLLFVLLRGLTASQPPIAQTAPHNPAPAVTAVTAVTPAAPAPDDPKVIAAPPLPAPAPSAGPKGPEASPPIAPQVLRADSAAPTTTTTATAQVESPPPPKASSSDGKEQLAKVKSASRKRRSDGTPSQYETEVITDDDVEKLK